MNNLTQTILLTGYSGFIGSHLLCSYPGLPWVLAGRSRYPSDEYNFIPLDFSNYALDVNLLAGAGVKTVVHTAGLAHIKSSKCDPYTVNFESCLAFAQDAASAGVERFIYISSTKVYGEGSFGSPFGLNDVCQPQDIYGGIKLKVEKALLDLSNETGMQVVILRPPLVYGAGVKGNLQALYRLLKFGLPMPLASISNKRDLISLPNLSSAIFAAIYLESKESFRALVSDGDSISTSELVRRVCDANHIQNRSFSLSQEKLHRVARLLKIQRRVGKLLGDFEVCIEDSKDLLQWEPNEWRLEWYRF